MKVPHSIKLSKKTNDILELFRTKEVPQKSFNYAIEYFVETNPEFIKYSKSNKKKK